MVGNYTLENKFIEPSFKKFAWQFKTEASAAVFYNSNTRCLKHKQSVLSLVVLCAIFCMRPSFFLFQFYTNKLLKLSIKAKSAWSVNTTFHWEIRTCSAGICCHVILRCSYSPRKHDLEISDRHLWGVTRIGLWYTLLQGRKECIVYQSAIASLSSIWHGQETSLCVYQNAFSFLFMFF